jgi:hypothetical protein
MEIFTKEELEEALKSLTSTLNKCKKVQEKLIQKNHRGLYWLEG